MECASGDGKSTLSAITFAAMGNSIWPMLRMATVFGPRGVSITALNGRSWPFSQYTRIFTGVLSGPCQSSMSASSGRPSVPRTTCTWSTIGERYDQVRSDPPCTRIVESCMAAPLVGITPPLRACDCGGAPAICPPTPSIATAGLALLWLRENIVAATPAAAPAIAHSATVAVSKNDDWGASASYWIGIANCSG